METKEVNEHQNSNESHNQEISKEKNKITSDSAKNDRENKYIFFIICLIGILLAVCVKMVQIDHLEESTNSSVPLRPKYWAYSEEGQHLLKHMHRVLNRLGYQQVPENDTDWDLLWSREYPFNKHASLFSNLRKNQRVNHFPGLSYLTQKSALSMTINKYIPRSFQLPKSKEEFLKYADKNKDALFVQKLNGHRGVLLKNVSEMDLSGDSFAQEYVKKPLLIDGYKFDIGIYMVLTSVNPLRLYWYKEDVLLRFCPEKYYPLDPNNVDKYVISLNYRPTWDIPSLAYSFNVLGLGMKSSFDSYLRTKNKDPEILWDKIMAAITDIFLTKEQLIINGLKNYPSPSNYFEMVRLDLMLDENLKVHLLEINMSPNIVADTKPSNQLLYEQVLYNVFRLTGIASRYENKDDPAEFTMISAPKNIATWGKECASDCMQNCSFSVFCGICASCRGSALTKSLQATHRENLDKGALRRLFPPKLKPGTSVEELMPTIKDLRESNQLLYLWYQGKCNDDVTWCA